jgi:hypothetical protein
MRCGAGGRRPPRRHAAGAGRRAEIDVEKQMQIVENLIQTGVQAL